MEVNESERSKLFNLSPPLVLLDESSTPVRASGIHEAIDQQDSR